MAKTYQSRPPATARSARRAWDYFAKKYPNRKIGTLCYSPRLDRNGPGWIAEWEFTPQQLDNALGHWGAMYGSTDWMQASIPSHRLTSI